MNLKQLTKKLLATLLALCLVLTVLPLPGAKAAGTNTDMASATPVQPGVPFTVESSQEYASLWYSFTTDQPGQYVYLSATAAVGTNTRAYVHLYSSNYGHLGNVMTQISGTAYTSYVCTDAPGTYYIEVQIDGGIGDHSAEIFFQLVDNDANEPNNTTASATPLTPGQTVDFTVAWRDYDYFSVTTAEDGQDIALTFSGFSHDHQGTIQLNFDGSESSKSVISNGTVYFHAAKAGTHIIRVNSGINSPFSLFMTADLLADDANEPNDTRESYTYLPMGTDATFRLGGHGDEDWFAFEAAVDPGETQKLYTLNFLDLNPDYTDELRYDVYAPDGTAVITDAYVNIRHSNVLACTQTGLYYVRVHTEDIYGSNKSMDLSRSLLRIRVEEGGADPYEGNDVWTDAAAVSVGAPVQFILASTADQDWFKIEVPQADMSLKITTDSRLTYYLFDSATLQEEGPRLDFSYNYLTWNNIYASDPQYYKFTTPGVYYLRLTSDSSYISQDLRSMTLELLPANKEEHNDSYLTAVPLFEGVPQSYIRTAGNDYEWFSIEVPAGVTQLAVCAEGNCDVFRKKDFESIGINAPSVSAGQTAVLNHPAPGTYYVHAYGSLCEEHQISYHLFYDALAGGTSIETAVPLPLGQWVDLAVSSNYYSLGALKAGDEVRLYSENIYDCYLYNSSGSSIASPGLSSDPYWTVQIPADDTYTLRIYSSISYDAAGRCRTGRILCDVGNTASAAPVIEGLPASLTLEVGQSYQVIPRLAPYNGDFDAKATNSTFSMSSGNSGILSTKNIYSGVFTAKAPGTTTVTVKPYSPTYSHLSFSYTITVTVVAAGSLTPATGLTIQGAPADMTVGEKVELTVDMQPVGANEAVSWSSSDPAVLYVSPSGSVTAVGAGTAIVTAATASGVSAQAQITVGPAPEKVPVTSVTLSDYDMTLYAGEAPTQLVATVNPANADYSGITWTSSNLNAATVDQQGNVTPLAAGISVITASAGDYKASCIVTVHGARVRVDSISFEQDTMDLPMNGKTTLVPIITPTDATVQNVTWLSSDETIAVVSRTGIVTALAVGTVTITATSVDNPELSATITINVTATAQLGDMNMDSFIDAADALMTLRYAVGAITLTEDELERADVNGDGFVDAGDAIRILRYDAGLIDKL